MRMEVFLAENYREENEKGRFYCKYMFAEIINKRHNCSKQTLCWSFCSISSFSCLVYLDVIDNLIDIFHCLGPHQVFISSLGLDIEQLGGLKLGLELLCSFSGS